MAAPQGEYLTLEEAAEYCRYSRSGFYRIVSISRALVDAGFPPKLQYARMGRKYLFRKEWLDAFLAPKVPEVRYIQSKPKKPRYITPTEYGKNWDILMKDQRPYG